MPILIFNLGGRLSLILTILSSSEIMIFTGPAVCPDILSGAGGLLLTSDVDFGSQALIKATLMQMIVILCNCLSKIFGTNLTDPAFIIISIIH
ncbi:MAG: hypothetical protein JKY84_10180 [Emcibacteraceae bacterium]|nr:hypothetical protein [Emcibacteraceae bacterium]